MTIDLVGRTALVTGASRGIGRACALRLASAGADVIINYLNSRAAAESVAQDVARLGRRSAVVRADVSEPDDVSAVSEFVSDFSPALDIIVSNAATGGFRSLIEATPQQFTDTLNTNARSLVLLMQGLLPAIQRSKHRGKVVAISSHGSQFALPRYGVLGASKAALESLVRHFALELGPTGINFNIILAGLVETDATRAMGDLDFRLNKARQRSLVPGPTLSASEIADAVLFMSSDLSDPIQGQTLIVDHGSSLSM